MPIYAISTEVFKQPKIYWGVISILFVVVWMVAYPRLYKRLIKLDVQKILRKGDTSFLFGKKTMIIDDKNIRIVTKKSSEIISKDSIKDININDDMILIYLSAVTAHIIPTRYLDEETKKSLLEKLGVE